MKSWINEASYEQLLARWRFSKSDDKMCQGSLGEYFAREMERKGSALSDAERVETSKRVGWEK